MLESLISQLRNLSKSALRPLRNTLKLRFSRPIEVEKSDATKFIEGWESKLRQSGVGNIDFNLRCIAAKVLGLKFDTLASYQNVQFTLLQKKRFERLCLARCARMPLQYIVGECNFMDITLKTAPKVFIPRPDTEEFVAKVIDVYRHVEQPIDMLEIGCGSGAISLAILNALPNVKVTALDRCRAATILARENAMRLKLHDRFTAFNHTTAPNNYLPKELKRNKYDLIISNPPFLRPEEFPLLYPEVRLYEPFYTLDGGPDGLRIARLLFDCACRHLKQGCKMWLELGSEQPPLVETIINLHYKGRMRYLNSYKDQYKRDRFVEIEKT